MLSREDIGHQILYTLAMRTSDDQPWLQEIDFLNILLRNINKNHSISLSLIKNVMNELKLHNILIQKGNFISFYANDTENEQEKYNIQTRERLQQFHSTGQIETFQNPDVLQKISSLVKTINKSPIIAPQQNPIITVATVKEVSPDKQAPQAEESNSNANETKKEAKPKKETKKEADKKENPKKELDHNESDNEKKQTPKNKKKKSKKQEEKTPVKNLGPDVFITRTGRVSVKKSYDDWF